MLMVCPNCHSDQIIAVQDQHFCINCGQMVPELPVEKPDPKSKSPVAVQENGLPEGVKILPVNPDSEPDQPVVEPEAPASEPATVEPPVRDDFIQHRARLQEPPNVPVEGSKRRKPGRPKAGRLDIPRMVARSKPAALPDAPKIAPAEPAPVMPHPVASTGPRSMSDIAPRPTAAARHKAEAAKDLPKPDERAKTSKPAKPRRARAHRVGVAPLHYAPVIAFSFRARVRPRLIGLAALATASLGVAAGYGVWLVLTHGVAGLAQEVTSSGPKLLIEVGLLAAVYYVGRSLGQAAITYGIVRESDQRPVTLSRQFGIAVNTFGRRLLLDIGFGVGELALLAAGVALFITGGETWPIDANLQIGIIFAAYIVLLYLFTASTISRGLAGVNLTLTTDRARTAAKVGWQLFSHRVELIGPRFGAILMEVVLAVPLVALGVALVLAAPPQYQILVTIGAGILAWLAGALLGVGTAAWWAMLYRQLVTADRPSESVAMLSSRQPEDARRAPLALIVALSTLIVAAILILPWIQLG